jgi:hypothetical protein
MMGDSGSDLEGRKNDGGEGVRARANDVVRANHWRVRAAAKEERMGVWEEKAGVWGKAEVWRKAGIWEERMGVWDGV